MASKRRKKAPKRVHAGKRRYVVADPEHPGSFQSRERAREYAAERRKRVRDTFG